MTILPIPWSEILVVCLRILTLEKVGTALKVYNISPRCQDNQLTWSVMVWQNKLESLYKASIFRQVPYLLVRPDPNSFPNSMGRLLWLTLFFKEKHSSLFSCETNRLNHILDINASLGKKLGCLIIFFWRNRPIYLLNCLVLTCYNFCIQNKDKIYIFDQCNKTFHAFSLIKEGATEKASQFIIPLNSICNKKVCFVDKKSIFGHNRGQCYKTFFLRNLRIF